MVSWKEKALKLARKRELSWRAIARELGQPKSTVSQFLRKNLGKQEEFVAAFNSNAKVLIFDIETAPSQYYGWSRWENHVGQEQVIQEGYMLTWAAKWLGSDTIISDAIWNYKEYKKDPENDKKICESLYKLIDEADIIIAHNVDNFDKKASYTRFLYHEFEPPHPSKTIDTLKIVKRTFKFPSNKLGNIAVFLGLIEKIDTGGFSLWKKCLEGDKKSQEKMLAYNEQDVLVLQELYLKIRSWDHLHPNLPLLNEDEKEQCVVCGSEKLKKTGKKVFTGVSVFETLRCKNCGKVNRRRQNVLPKEKKKATLTNAGK